MSQAEHQGSLRYDRWGRLLYHPDIHGRHGLAWTTADERYLIENYHQIGPEAVSLALEKTIGSVMQRANELRKKGLLVKPTVRVLHKRIRSEVPHGSL